MDQELELLGEMAAIVCEHIARNRVPIRSAFRQDPVEPEDSGWQFFCGDFVEENPSNARVWQLQEVLAHDPSLRAFATESPSIRLWRENATTQWNIRRD